MTRLRIAVATVAVFVSAVAAHAQTTAIGTWDLTTVSPLSETKSVLEIRKEGDKLVAVGKSAQGERPYDKVAVEGANITLVVTISYEGSPMVITYTGKIDGAKIEGSADFGGLATGTFSATAAK
jgi:hypothetical protein